MFKHLTTWKGGAADWWHRRCLRAPKPDRPAAAAELKHARRRQCVRATATTSRYPFDLRRRELQQVLPRLLPLDAAGVLGGQLPRLHDADFGGLGLGLGRRLCHAGCALHATGQQ